MKNSKLWKIAIINSLITFVYVALVAFVMFNGGQFFGNINNFVGPLAILLLFVFSALVVGLLILGKPVIFYLDSKKTDAVKLLSYTIISLFILIVLTFITLLIIK